MSALFFFTDLHLLADAGAPNGQIAGDEYGPLSPTQFRLNSLHKSKTADDPTAYAVTKGVVLIHDIGDGEHVNLILEPIDQPSKNPGIGVPRIKYFIYRHVKRSSLLVADSSPVRLVPKGTIDLVDEIRDKYGDKKAPEVPVDKFLASGAPTATIASVFATRQLHPVAAGKSIGRFDPDLFSFEILLDDVGFEPDLAYASLEPHQQCIWNVPVPASSNADQFTARAKREYVLHFLDPCAFYGNSYLTGLQVKNNGKVEKIKGLKPDERDQLYPVLQKFRNHNRAYIDIRNENNHSYNYYRFVNDPKKDLFSIYGPDLLDVTFTNDAAGKVPPPIGPPPPPADYYGSGGWPLLIVKNSDFPAGNTKKKNLVSISMPKGNNGNATLFVAAGILNKGPIDGSLEEATVIGEPQFSDLVLQLSGTSYEPFELVIPNNAASGGTAVIPTYSRVKYLRRVAAVNFANDPAATDVQYADHLFPPLLLKDTFSEPRPTSYESEQYVDLSNADQLSDSEYVGCTQVALGQNNVTFCCYPVYERGRRSRLKNPRSEPALRSATLEQYVSGFAVPFAERPPVYMIQALDLLPDHPKIIHYDQPFSLFRRWFSEEEFSDVVMLILSRKHYDDIVAMAAKPSVLSPLFDCYLVIKEQTHRDRNVLNDTDNSDSPIPFSSCSLFLRGFKLNGANVEVAEVDTQVRLYAKRESRGTTQKIHPILTDRDAVLNGTSQFKPFDALFLVDDSTLPPTTGIDALKNIYTSDLTKFITDLRTAADGGDPTSIRLRDKVFNKFIKATAPSLKLNFEDSRLRAVEPIDQGLLIEGANYFAVWKIADSLGKIITEIDKGTSAGSLRASYESYVTTYAFLNNLIESLRGDGIRSPVEILADTPDDEPVPDLRDKFMGLFGPNLSAAEIPAFETTPAKPGILENIRKYYEDHDRLLGPTIADEDLKRTIDNFTAAKQQYLSDLTALVYRGLGGTVAASDYTFINVAIGDGRDTAGLFGEDERAIFLYNYSFDEKAKRARDKIVLDDIPLPVTSDDTLAVHFGIYGINSVATPFNHSIKVRTRDGDSDFILSPQPGLSFTAKPVGTPRVGKWNDANKDLELEKPLTGGVTSIRLDLDSFINANNGDEQSFSLAFYKRPAVIKFYAQAFEELYPDDVFIVPQAKIQSLWPADDSATLKELLKVLDKDGTTLELELMVAGGVGRRKKPDQSKKFDPRRAYWPGTVVVYEDLEYKALVEVPAGPFLPEQWLMQSMVETDPDFRFRKDPNSARWIRDREETEKPLANTPEEKEYPRLRYSYASIVFHETSKKVIFRVESYASPVYSKLDLWRPAIGAGMQPAWWNCLDPQPTIIKKDPAFDANVKDAQHKVVYSDSYNLLLSALRSCGLLDALLERIKLEIFVHEELDYTKLAKLIDQFKAHPSVKVMYTPFPWEDELKLSRFLQMITTGCP